MPYCEKCGSKIRESASFCPSCGAKIPDEINSNNDCVTDDIRMMKAVLFINTILRQSVE